MINTYQLFPMAKQDIEVRLMLFRLQLIYFPQPRVDSGHLQNTEVRLVFLCLLLIASHGPRCSSRKVHEAEGPAMTNAYACPPNVCAGHRSKIGTLASPTVTDMFFPACGRPWPPHWRSTCPGARGFIQLAQAS